MSIIYRLYDKMTDILALVDSDKLAEFKASKEMQSRFNQLLEKSNNNTIDRVEKDELDHFIVLERLIRLAKLKADKEPTV